MQTKGKPALVGAIEGGGTKFVVAVGTGPHDLTRTEFPTGDQPARVLSAVGNWLGEQQRLRGTLQAIGIASFGPVDLDKNSPTYGYVTATVKPGWSHTDIVGSIQSLFPGIPIGFDTDVNGAACGEHAWGHAVGLQDFVYITIGTGIGAGGMSGGRLIHGLVHPEMGHMRIPRIPGDTFAGACSYHGDCWEGLCCGPAILKRTGLPAEQLPPDHEAWELETQYIAYALANLLCVLSPRRIIIGGSVRKAGQLGSDRFFQMIRQKTQKVMNGYLASPSLHEEIDRLIVPPLLGDNAGVCGAMALAQEAVAARADVR